MLNQKFFIITIFLFWFGILKDFYHLVFLNFTDFFFLLICFGWIVNNLCRILVNSIINHLNFNTGYAWNWMKLWHVSILIFNQIILFKNLHYLVINQWFLIWNLYRFISLKLKNSKFTKLTLRTHDKLIKWLKVCIL